MENKLLQYLPKKKQWFVILLIGLLLVVIALPTNGSLDSEQKTENQDTYEYYEEYEDATDEERHLEHVLSCVQNVGDVHVMITYKDNSQVRGIVVVAQGAGDENVVRNIVEVTQALFDVDSHKIKVIKSK